MNAKRCKALRRIAQQGTVGSPEVSYARHIQRGNVIAHPQSTRGAYRYLKRKMIK